MNRCVGAGGGRDQSGDYFLNADVELICESAAIFGGLSEGSVLAGQFTAGAIDELGGAAKGAEHAAEDYAAVEALLIGGFEREGRLENESFGAIEEIVDGACEALEFGAFVAADEANVKIAASRGFAGCCGAVNPLRLGSVPRIERLH